MQFGPHPATHLFHIEKSTVYADRPDGVKMAEFLLLDNTNVLLVEAKSSSPRPGNLADFPVFLTEIREKMTNALALFVGIRLGRHTPAAQAEVPSNLATLNLSTANFRFVLVIRGHKDEWLPPLQEALNLELRGLAGAFSISAPFLAVINDDMARRKKLIA